jgi:outer membrane receptor for ferric coprogen and ferric-rhodotorulic acid
MKTPSTLLAFARSCRAGICACTLAVLVFDPTSPAIAQKTDQPADSLGSGQASDSNEITVLDPFVVSASEDRDSYEATATMAATRIRTELKDVGSAISVVTSQFLKDTNSHNSQDLLVYTTNTEVGGPGGNFSGLGDAATLNDLKARLAPLNNTRIRGLTAADNTRDFFLTDIPWDSFNTGRIDVQRGPNAILFGLGSPAGIVNASINAAAFKNEGSVEFSTGSYGSHRATLDFNHVLLPQELALRFDTLDDRTEYEQRPAYNHDRRLYGALRWDPKFLSHGSAHTSLRINFEHGKIDANRPHVVPPTDMITPWFAELNRLGIDPTGGWQSDPNINSKVAGLGALTGANLLAIFGNPSSSDSVLTLSGTPLVQLARVLSPAEYLPRSSSPAEFFKVYRSSQLQDPSIFDYVHQMPEGPNKREWSNHDIGNAALSQTFFDDRLGLEVAYDRQHALRAAYGGADDSLTVDINTRLLDGSPNPNFGRVFLQTYGTDGTVFRSTREATRLTGFGELRFKDVLGDSPLAHVLGRHVITGLWSHEKADSEQYSWVGQTADAAFVPYWFNDPNLYDRRIYTFNYIGPSLANRTTAAGANLPSLSAIQTVHSGNLRYFDLPRFFSGDPSVTWTDLPLGVVNNDNAARVGGGNALLRRDDVTSAAFVWQAYLFDGLLVPMVGVRHDNDRAYSLTNPPRNDDRSTDFSSPDYRLPSSPNGAVAGDSTSWGVVAHSPQFIRAQLPGGTDFSLFYNRSENFQPKAGRIDPFGASLPPPVGHTKDYGFSLTTLGGRLTAKVNWYDTAVEHDSLSEFDNFLYLDATEIWGYQNAQQTLDNNGNGSFYFAGGFQPGNGQTAADAKADGIKIATAFLDPKNQPPDSFYALYHVDRSRSSWASYSQLSPTNPTALGVTITGDTRSTGVEYELTAQPAANWNLTFNAARTDAQSHNLAQSVATWIEQRWAVYNTPVPGTSIPSVVGDMRLYGPGPDPGSTVRSQYHDIIWIPYLIYRAKENSQVHELRPWHFNLVTDYTFRQGWLKGAKLGGAYRWQDREVIGYPVLASANDSSTQAFDLAHPYRGPAETNVDAWIGYERKFGKKYTWRLQLNVNNIFAKKDLIPVTVQPDGSLAAGRIPPPRIWTLTNSISF